MNKKQVSIAAIREEKPTLSVFVLCYNQEDYILQTIKSILTQKTNFPFDIIISDDASTDGTSEICENLALTYTNINYIKRESNLGSMINFTETAKELKGKYVAICDGDDYWIDNNKLQLQVDFLEKNTNYSVVGTRCKQLSANNILNSNKKVFKSSIDYQRLKLMMAYNREKKHVDGLLLMLQILSSSFSFALMKKYLYSIKKSIS